MAKAHAVRGLRADGTLADFAARTLIVRAAEAEAFADAAADRSDPEDLHSFRVGLRRLRGAMSTYAEVFSRLSPEWDELSLQVKTVFQATSALRDCDVGAQRLMDLQAEVSDEAALVLTSLLRQCAQRAAVAELLVDGALGKFHTQDVFGRLSRMGGQLSFLTTATVGVSAQAEKNARLLLGKKALRAGSARKALLGQLQRRVGKVEKRLLPFLNDLDDDLDEAPSGKDAEKATKKKAKSVPGALSFARAAYTEDLHDLRIEIKKLRYVGELVADTPFGAHVVGVLPELQRMQDLLGDIHDVDVLLADIKTLMEGTGETLGKPENPDKPGEEAGNTGTRKDCAQKPAAHTAHQQVAEHASGNESSWSRGCAALQGTLQDQRGLLLAKLERKWPVKRFQGLLEVLKC